MGINSIKKWVSSHVWGTATEKLSRPKAAYLHSLRMIYVVGRDLSTGQLNLRAMSLVYTTLLSLVPILAISFTVLKGFGVHNEVGPVLFSLFEPLGAKGAEITLKIIEFVERMKVGVLGSVGLVLLLYTVVSVMQKIERAFNFIWHISETRPFAQRFSDYLSVILVGPVLIVVSTGISATAMSNSIVKTLVAIEPLGTLIQLGLLVLPIVLSITAFSFFYVFIPNTRVKMRSAIVGAIAASVLWKITGWAFASFVVTSTQYAAVYSAFASLIFFMIWLYLTWLILMVGASIAFYHQHPEYLAFQTSERRLSNRVKEKLALLVMSCISTNLYKGNPAWTLEGLASDVKAPIEAIAKVLSILEEAGFIVKTHEDDPTFIPGKPLDTTPVIELIHAIRESDETNYIGPEAFKENAEVELLVQNVENSTTNALRGKTVKDLVSLDIEDHLSIKTVPVGAAE
jgi:membrane protein